MSYREKEPSNERNSGKGCPRHMEAKSLDTISPDFVNSFRWKNNRVRRGCNPKPYEQPLFSVSVDVAKNTPERKEPIVIDHRGSLSLALSLCARCFGERVEVGQGAGTPVICFAREDYRVITRDESRVFTDRLVGPQCSKTRKHLPSRITFLNWGWTSRNLRGSRTRTDTCPTSSANYSLANSCLFH